MMDKNIILGLMILMIMILIAYSAYVSYCAFWLFVIHKVEREFSKEIQVRNLKDGTYKTEHCYCIRPTKLNNWIFDCYCKKFGA